jgi:hypothetical protein
MQHEHWNSVRLFSHLIFPKDGFKKNPGALLIRGGGRKPHPARSYAREYSLQEGLVE